MTQRWSYLAPYALIVSLVMLVWVPYGARTTGLATAPPEHGSDEHGCALTPPRAAAMFGLQ